ncbi:MAG: S24 family peptidase [Flavobacteriaceae bacterium]
MNILELKEIRNKLGLSRGDFAEKIGVSKETLDTWEYRTKEIPDDKQVFLTNLFSNIIGSQKDGKEVKSLHVSKSAEYKIETQEIPLYDIEVTAGVVSLFKDPQSTKPIDTIRIPNMPKCDGAMTVTGDSMYPLVKSGDIVFYKTISDIPESVFYGNMYIVSLNIEGDELVMLKYIQKGKDNNHLLLVSENRHHADKEIHIKYINGIALVKGNVRFNFTT